MTYSRKGKANLLPTEEQEQRALVQWLEMRGILFYHVPNGGMRDAREGRKFKLLGVKPGVPDICIPIGCFGYHALYVELKRRVGGSLSAWQELWIQALRSRGNKAEVANGCEEAISIISEYLGI
jgi:hypothetical protein